jgi:hypothetical protein
LCKAGYLAFWNGNCEKPGSPEALAAAADEGNESARQEINFQKHKAKEAEERRKEMEREFRRKQKEREENIRALERRIRELIREKTNARITDRDTRIGALNDHIVSLQTAQSEAAKTASTQLALIKALEKSESHKVKRLTAAMEAATSKIADAARAYAERVRARTEAEMRSTTESSQETGVVPPPAPKPSAAPKSSLPARKPASPPQYHNAHSAQPLKLPINQRTTRHGKPAAAPKPKPARKIPKSIKKATADQGTNVVPRFAQVHSEAEASVDAQTEAAAVQSLMKSDLSADLQNLASVSDAELAQSDQDLQSELAKLHAEVDSHLDEVLHSEDAEEEADEEEADE